MTTTTVAPSKGDLLAVLQDEATAKAIFSDPEKKAQWDKDYAAAEDAYEKRILNLAAEQSAVALQDMLKADAGRTQVPLGPTNKHYAKNAPGVRVSGIFDSFGDLALAAYDGQKDKGLVAKRDQLMAIQNGMTTQVPSDGGFLVPEEYRSELMVPAIEASVVRQRASVIPMGAARVKIPAIDATTNATSLYGGVITYWTSEEAALTESKPKFGEVVLDANKHTAWVPVSRELLADSPISIEGILRNLVPSAIMFSEDVKFLRGNGVGEPLGILNAPAKVTVDKRTGQLATTIVWENILDMYSRLLPGSLASAVWAVHPNTFPELGTMVVSNAIGGSPIWLTAGAAQAPMSILGLPVIVSEKMSTLGTEGDIALIDFSHYLIGDRQTLEIEASRDFLFSTDQIAYRFIERLDGRPSLLSAITPYKGSGALSAYVTLQTRS